MRLCKYGAILLVALSLINPIKAWSAPPAGIVQTFTQPNNDTFDALLHGDEYASWMETTDGYSIVEVNGEWFYAELDVNDQLVSTGDSVGSLTPAELALMDKGIVPVASIERPNFILRSIAAESFLRAPEPVVQNVLVIRVSFSGALGYYIQTPLEWAEDLIFDADNSHSTSIKDYYSSVSYGKFLISPATETFGSNDGFIDVTLNGDHPNNGTENIKTIHSRAAEAIGAANQYINYKDFDTNDDDEITPDELSIILLVSGFEYAFQGANGFQPTIWAHKSATTPVTYDGVALSDYAAFAEIHTNGSTFTLASIGIVCHELGHLMFGLPDLYDIDKSNGDSEGIGDWGLMGTGMWNGTSGDYTGFSPALPSAWSRSSVGFATPTTITSSSSNLSVESSDLFDDIKELWVDKYKSPVGERFLVENRQKAGYDSSLPAAGLLIFHIDGSQYTNGDENRKWVDLEEANNDGDLDANRNQGDNGDPFKSNTNNTTFHNTSSPNSKDYAGNLTGIEVTSVSSSSDTMTADFTPSSYGRNRGNIKPQLTSGERPKFCR